MTSKGKIFVFTAPSGAGKTSIAKRILESYPDFVFSISATTRRRRKNETEGKDYFFLSEKEFLLKRDNNEFIEWEEFYDYYYGTLRSFIDEKLNNGKNIVLDIDVKGALNIIRNYPEAVSFFINPPSKEVLIKRLIGRNTETEDDLKKRKDRANMELSYCDKFHYQIINEDLEVAVNEVKVKIDKELNKE
ncbi:MAG: guanylate kinase [Melioribacteraceae bacterium]|nr:guanylate kinase [Melioribacteraceae bacterium]